MSARRAHAPAAPEHDPFDDEDTGGLPSEPTLHEVLDRPVAGDPVVNEFDDGDGFEPMPTQKPRELVGGGFPELQMVYDRLHELRLLVDKDQKKIEASRKRRDAEERRCKLLEIEFDPDLAPPLYTGNAKLHRALHEQHHVIAAVEKKLNVRQPIPPRREG